MTMMLVFMKENTVDGYLIVILMWWRLDDDSTYGCCYL